MKEIPFYRHLSINAHYDAQRKTGIRWVGLAGYEIYNRNTGLPAPRIFNTVNI